MRVRTNGEQWEAQQVHDADLGNHGRVQVGVLRAPGHMLGCITRLLDSGSRHIACRLVITALQALIDRAPTGSQSKQAGMQQLQGLLTLP